MNILITGASGYIGGLLAGRLSTDHTVVGISRRGNPEQTGYLHLACDVRDPGLASLLREHAISHVVHLAAVLEDADPELAYDIDVNGTLNVLEACVTAGVQHLTVTSSGAAYGYHADNPKRLTEDHPLRGNEEFTYARNKRQVEQLLARYRAQNPELQQLILRVCTVLGDTADNLITRLFEKPRIPDVAGNQSGFVFIWDQDLVEILQRGVTQSKTGVFNVAGDGVVTLADIAQWLGKPRLALPATLMKLGLGLGRALRLTQYGPAQVGFLQHRPMLANDRLKTEFGYCPSQSSAEVFHAYARHRGWITP